jgi:hypothetical protein
MPIKEETMFQEQFQTEWDDAIYAGIDDSLESKSFHEKRFLWKPCPGVLTFYS